VATLALYNDYSRSEIHDIFGPDETFVPGAGTWGIHGIINIRRRPGDYVFFVSFGQEIAGEPFVESITNDGVLSWQSQPSQNLEESRIRQFIAHDELTNSIYLFLRTRSHTGLPYTYLGRLKYLSHDKESGSPVRMKWQILDWNIGFETLQRIKLVLRTESRVVPPGAPQGQLIQNDPPAPKSLEGQATFIFNSNTLADNSGRESKNKELGDAGEELVVANEKRILAQSGYEDLAKKVRHVAKIEGDGAGYDVLSFTIQGQEKYIEVKTTRGLASSSFFITCNELKTSERLDSDFYVYRVYEYVDTSRSGKYFVIRGNLRDALKLTPTAYRATL
jgi:hypothetical protein